MIQYKRWVSMAVVATTVTVMTLGVNTQAAEHHTEMMYASDHMEIASFAQLLQDSEKTDEIVKILDLILKPTYSLFHCDKIATKAIHEARSVSKL